MNSLCDICNNSWSVLGVLKTMGICMFFILVSVSVQVVACRPFINPNSVSLIIYLNRSLKKALLFKLKRTFTNIIKLRGSYNAAI